MNDKLDLHYKLADISNDNLKNTQEIKEEMINEVFNSDLLSATLKAHMYIERELNNLYEYYFGLSKTFTKLNFATKLDLLHELNMVDTDLYHSIKKLNQIRNDFAHNLYSSKENHVYTKLLNTLSNNIKKLHEIEIRMKEIINGSLNEEEKYKILLAQLWIHIRIFCSTKEQRKMDFGNRLSSEVKTDIEKSNLDLK